MSGTYFAPPHHSISVVVIVSLIFSPSSLLFQEGESVSIRSHVVKPAAPKVIDLKIDGDLRENSKVTTTGTVTEGIEGLAEYRAKIYVFRVIIPQLLGRGTVLPG
ncbi:hypothetical protein C1H46_018138 [Malus baccata]|uniref:Uncharacterized protein n=1 Tax=Malus baccata TaxID=106549 RepID=A0A540MCS1_MALBA|nr:hypothetical protein C1H46_018138 [Malus baccata]